MLKLHLSLENRRVVVAFTLSQMGVAWHFDGVQYRELQQVIAQQVQAIQLLFSKPERLLSLLPASATLHKGRSREQNLRLRQLQQRALSALHLHRTRGIGRARCWRHRAGRHDGGGVKPGVRGQGGMGFMKDVAQARAYVEQLQRLYGYSRLAKAS
ncbi:hypothetical protein [Aeromonas salmonicida]|uniref:hypothetical protein n=1 Tax=Aeromonas salmonicida TaxID=645 RepID=UPI0012D88C87|nr:hypothetical protein [Aeromonas salmonicida]MUG29440.1 hypothetical protein [Aeromonas salmonicida]